MENRQIARATNGNPVNLPAGSFGSADASRVIPAANIAESAGEKDWTESIATGATTPPMKPMFQGRGGGAAVSCSIAQTLVSATAGSSALCTAPFRANRVTAAGRGMAESWRADWTLSGAITNAWSAAPAGTSNTGPAFASQFLVGEAAMAAESAACAARSALVSTGTGAFARSHAAKPIDTQRSVARRTVFIRRNLDSPSPPSTGIRPRLREETYAGHLPGGAKRSTGSSESQRSCEWHIPSIRSRSFFQTVRYAPPSARLSSSASVGRYMTFRTRSSR